MKTFSNGGLLSLILLVAFHNGQSYSNNETHSASLDTFNKNGTISEDDWGIGGGGEGFLTGFVSSLEVTILSELGDNSFFISLVLAMKNSRILVFCGSMSAFFFMTIFTAFFGLVSTLIPRIYTYYLSIVIFTAFGIKMIYDGVALEKDKDVDEQIQEVDENIIKKENEEGTTPMTGVQVQVQPIVDRSMNYDENKVPINHLAGIDPEECYTPLNGQTTTVVENETLCNEENKVTSTIMSVKKKKQTNCCGSKYCHVYLQALTMTFLAEWGDRSQLAIVVIAATENIWGTCVGCLLGHVICCGIAVIGGRLIAKKISVKTVTIIGGIMFLGFAIISLLFLKPKPST